MKSLAAVISSALAATGAFAQQATVKNHCQNTVYVQSWPYDGSAPGPLTTVKPGETFCEDFRRCGSTIKIAKTKTLDGPLFFGYSFSSYPNYAYYEFSTRWGNPFAGQHNVLTPGDGCQLFDCSPYDANCYSTPGMSRVYGCPLPVDLEAHLCL